MLGILTPIVLISGYGAYVYWQNQQQEDMMIDETNYHEEERDAVIAGTLLQDFREMEAESDMILMENKKGSTLTNQTNLGELYGKYVSDPSFPYFTEFLSFRNRPDVVMRDARSYTAFIAKYLDLDITQVSPVPARDWVFTKKGNENDVIAFYYNEYFFTL